MNSKLLSVNVDYTSIPEEELSAGWSDEMDYLRSRILTERSVAGQSLTISDGVLFEVARTLVDLVDYTLRGWTSYIEDITTIIDRGEGGGLPVACIETTLRHTNRPSHIHCQYFYSPVPYAPHGAFFINIISSLDAKFRRVVGISDTINDTREILPEKCFKAGKVLKYSENFPSPVNMRLMVDSEIRSVMEEVASV